jgi:putative transposase
MSHSYICCLIHVVFATADRRPLIRGDAQQRLHAYIGGIARKNGMAALAVGGVADHVHALLSLPCTITAAKAVQLLKAGSSKWLKESCEGLRGFAWQEGYAAFSVSISQRNRVVDYLLHQPEHHKRMSFAEEFSKLLRAHGITEELSRPFGDLPIRDHDPVRFAKSANRTGLLSVIPSGLKEENGYRTTTSVRA